MKERLFSLTFELYRSLHHFKGKPFSTAYTKSERINRNTFLWQAANDLLENHGLQMTARETGDKTPSLLNLSSPIQSDLRQMLYQELVPGGKCLTGNYETQLDLVGLQPAFQILLVTNSRSLFK